MYNYNHRQRRKMEKDLGLLAEFKKLSEAEKAEVRRRKREAGIQIHLRNVQEMENQKIQAEAESYAKRIQSWIEGGKTPEEAEAIVKKNYEIAEMKRAKKEAKKEARKNK